MNNNTSKIKLSSKQKEVIMLMREGWNACISRGINTRTWMQIGKIGYGGKSKDGLRYDTLYRLSDLGLIEDSKDAKRLSDTNYTISELGKKIQL